MPEALSCPVPQHYCMCHRQTSSSNIGSKSKGEMNKYKFKVFLNYYNLISGTISQLTNCFGFELAKAALEAP